MPAAAEAIVRLFALILGTSWAIGVNAEHQACAASADSCFSPLAMPA